MKIAHRKKLTGLLFVSPFLIGFVAFYLRGLIQTVQFSLSDVTLGQGAGYSLSFAGLKHYIFGLTAHGSFRQDLTVSILDMVIDVPLIIFLSLFMALLLNQQFKGRTTARAIFFLPVILNSEAISTAINMARAMMMGGMSPVSADIVQASASGSVNIGYYLYMLQELALPASLLQYIVGAVTRINHIITASGVQLVIFIAALQSISPAMYEVAKIEGATPYETFWKVTFPLVLPLIVTNIVYTVVDSFTRSQVVELSYRTIFELHNYPLGSVFSLISMVLVCTLLLIVSTVISKRTYYHN